MTDNRELGNGLRRTDGLYCFQMQWRPTLGRFKHAEYRVSCMHCHAGLHWDALFFVWIAARISAPAGAWYAHNRHVNPSAWRPRPLATSRQARLHRLKRRYIDIIPTVEQQNCFCTTLLHCAILTLFHERYCLTRRQT